MKTYFCKYLPVEGEIKLGDKYTSPGWGSDVYTMADTSGKVDYSKEQKVKLFLCTRDMQPADKVVQISTGKEFKMGFGGTGEGFVKIIGEISPEAIFIKEGDEFNDEDTKCTPKGERVETSQNPDGSYNATYEFRRIVKIKGPCGHFH